MAGSAWQVLVRLPVVAPDDGSAAKGASAENIFGRRDAPAGRLAVARWAGRNASISFRISRSRRTHAHPKTW